RQLEDRAHAMLADHRTDLGLPDTTIVGAPGERGLADLPQQQGRVVTDPLHEQARGLLAEGQALELSALSEPLLEHATPPNHGLDDRARVDDAQEPVLGLSLAAG